ncbi:geranylgeranyl diphosphate synthase type II [Kineothrix alysoides]|uniref:Farnesyl diphosphate synthase n=1 Tax=Kineothrix alysoides TaxID=1469948 RepID=A0A4R1QZF2_9FIRM|nr:farnesyl diphosphate synthase [Kineothrix alysoides]TCL58366.1 geranylgeranyl diphosphate synthase type II [Kineothrix alysoides]
MNFKDEMAKRTMQIEEIILRFLPEEKGYQKTVIEAMNYSILAGGKRLRPMLLQETYKMFHGEEGLEEPFMAALEMIHTYSLVHDDLPCMDDDEYRRGRKTTHAVYGEGMAVLAGDALLNFAFETAVTAFSRTENAQGMERVYRALSILAGKAGIFGMIGGQTADIEAENIGSEVTQDQLLFIYGYKTAALIQSAMMIGATLAGASDEELSKIETCAYSVGIAFQIQDDILDITGSLEVLGKQTGSDEKNHKSTYVALNGMERAKAEVERLSEEAAGILSSFDNRNEFLEALIKQLITREK